MYRRPFHRWLRDGLTGYAQLLPEPYLNYLCWRWRRRLGHQFARVRKGTQIVIEGYPRSANTFATVAFREAQGTPIQMAHHMHTAAQGLFAVRHDIPFLCLVRNPDDAIVSELVKNPNYNIETCYIYYAHFYRPLNRFIDQIAVATFEQVTSDFGAVIDRLNERYNCQFKRFDHTSTASDHIFELIEREHLADLRSAVIDETYISRPSEARRSRRGELRASLLRPQYANRRSEAWRLYEAFRASAEAR